MCGYRYNYEGQFEALQLADAGRSCFFSGPQNFINNTYCTAILALKDKIRWQKKGQCAPWSRGDLIDSIDDFNMGLGS